MQFVLTGFNQELGFRIFSFERIGDDGIRTKFTVKADLALVQRYGIRMHELPLLCWNFLEWNDREEARVLTISEDRMAVHSKETAASSRRRGRQEKDFAQPDGQKAAVCVAGCPVTTVRLPRKRSLEEIFMPTLTEEPVVDEHIWRAWIQRGRRREEAGARRMKMAAGIAAILLVLGGVFYKFVMR